MERTVRHVTLPTPPHLGVYAGTPLFLALAVICLVFWLFVYTWPLTSGARRDWIDLLTLAVVGLGLLVCLGLAFLVPPWNVGVAL